MVGKVVARCWHPRATTRRCRPISPHDDPGRVQALEVAPDSS